MSKTQQYVVMIGLFAEMVLDKALVDYRIRQLNQEIDKSLVEGDRKTFYLLIEELKLIQA
ncbi:IDEAL domain-containing protein [Paenibacillus sp. L3-i20]|uniref:IDEAL domain-containing protein n=1 Tax=Paenibacillus sp. L3-i20 TaxID=2905833 RepID=UPI001EDF8634|nr:IDEAL domain-containing protein [Paenibacillus sp. L3-i20]GKU80161.1 hypothetical protein L3i20_v245580 [Paenibacillus sp. L3-i20]